MKPQQPPVVPLIKGDEKLHLVDIIGQYKRIKPEVDDAIHRVLESGQFILGKEVEEFERNVQRYLDVQHAVGCASGTDALQVAMMALGIGPGDEVMTTPFTFVATVETIVLLGAKPVFVDIELESYDLNPDLVENAITKKTKAIIPVHLYGQPADMDKLLNIANKHNLHLIEDAAQAIGAEYKGQKVGTIGDIGCISFFPSKNLGAYGDAGMVVTNDKRLADRMRMIIVHGSKVRYYHDILGVNSRLDTIQAAVLNVKLKYLNKWNRMRVEAALRYNDLFRGTPIITPAVKPDRTHIFHQYTIRVKKREELTKYLQERKIPFAIYYPVPLHRQKAFQHLADPEQKFPVTEQCTREVLSLPMHTELTFEMQEYIVQAIKEFYS
jgi:dTDP-4-amino-4,6-dideoxygalactose transaminase